MKKHFLETQCGPSEYCRGTFCRIRLTLKSNTTAMQAGIHCPPQLQYLWGMWLPFVRRECMGDCVFLCMYVTGVTLSCCLCWDVAESCTRGPVSLMNLTSPLCAVQGDSLTGVWEHNSSRRFLLAFAAIIVLSVQWFTNQVRYQSPKSHIFISTPWWGFPQGTGELSEMHIQCMLLFWENIHL